MNQLQQRILEEIYHHETLTYHQLIRYHFNEYYNQEKKLEFDQSIYDLLKQAYIIQEKELEVTHYFLTTKGIEEVRQSLNLPENIMTSTKKILFRGYYPASKIKPKTCQLDRQYRLNEFEGKVKYHFEKNLKEKNLGYYYTDRKFFPEHLKFTGAQGMLDLLGRKFLIHVEGIDYTVTGLPKFFQQTYVKRAEEMREYYPSQPLFHAVQGEITLFVLATDKEKAKRWERAIYPMLKPFLSPHFELVIGTEHDLLNYLFNQYISKEQGTRPLVQQTEQLLTRLNCSYHYDYLLEDEVIGYYQGVIQSKNSNVSMLFSYYQPNGHATLQAYLNHILNYETLKAKGYPATFLLIVPNKEEFYHQLEEMSTYEETFQTPLSYITTPEDLVKASTLEQAILQSTALGWERGILPKHLR